VGEGADGERIVADCRRHGMDTTELRRTFWFQRGANALLASEHFDFTDVRAKMVHLG
jgi:hypothetical protein